MTDEKPINDPISLKNSLSCSIPFGDPRVDSLVELALDLRWSWNHWADEIWRMMDTTLWDETHNPWVILQTISHDRLLQILADPEFCSKLSYLVEHKRQMASAPAWFQETHPKSSLTNVVYFCMEFMLSEALPIYSGGLGNVAGDQLKSANDLGVPVIAISLLYQQGYFRQIIDKDGSQQALFPYNDPGQLPITPVRQPNGEWLRLKFDLPGYSLWVRVWQVQVSRLKLYLLDTNDAANYPAHRGITSELYGGGTELRIKQELLLGIGGWRLLEALGIKPEVCHLNEGHAAFTILERARDYMKQAGVSFEVALDITRTGNIFTTHTAVPAGFDRFYPALMEQYLGDYVKNELGISMDALMALGRQNPNDKFEPFNMAYLAMRGCGKINGVSKLHGKVSRWIFNPLFPRWPEDEVPVGHVTNGVHTPSWDSQAADALWTEACGNTRWLGSPEIIMQKLRAVPDAKIWQMRNDSRRIMIEGGRKRLVRQFTGSGYPIEEIEMAKQLFDPNVLTLGFARRFATYKRPNMLLHDPERLIRILTNPQKKVQLFLAGKAHPEDHPGQALIQEWVHFFRRPEVRKNAVFISDHDILVTERMAQGVDVWLNTPRRPWEASGTSGMKVLVNGGLNLSELDGWWAEAYAPELGWALGDGQEHDEDPAWDAKEAEDLYDLLENKVIPEFYNRDANGIPVAWIARIRESMGRLTPQYSTYRSVREYTDQYYIPAAENYRKRSDNKGALGKQIFDWKRDFAQKWQGCRFGTVKINDNEQNHVFEVIVYLNGLDLNSVRVQLCAMGGKDGPQLQQMTKVNQLADQGYLYKAEFPKSRPAADYTPRIIPYHTDVSIPLEANQILWQR